ncbi:MATE family efflux transporter [Poriferisphaera sp. WC338]|uniref:MATE family efflux transporter n=1 Tax=Poriferisphaera sp. WC338 TaxID=3425129 RepID=UPI003D8161C0
MTDERHEDEDLLGKEDESPAAHMGDADEDVSCDSEVKREEDYIERPVEEDLSGAVYAGAVDASGVAGDVIEGLEAGGQARRAELSGNLKGRSLLGQIYVLAVWPFFELLGISFVGLVDIALSGRLGGMQSARALDSVGVAAYVTWLIAMLFAAVGVGAGALVARAIGGKNRVDANRVLGQAIMMGVVWGSLIGFALWMTAPLFGRLFNLQGETLDLCTLYLRILSLATPVNAVVALGTAALRSAGDTRTPFIAIMVINVVNIFASWLLTFGPEPWGGHGVGGIAGGTAISWVVGGLLIAVILIRGQGPDFISWTRWEKYLAGDRRMLSSRHAISIRQGNPLAIKAWMPVRVRLSRLPIKLRLRWMMPNGELMWRIIKIGIPSLIESGGMWFGNLLIAGIVGGLGVWGVEEVVDGVMGAHVVGIRIESLSFLPGMAIGISAATLVGQYLGLGDKHRAKQAAILSWLIGSSAMGIIGLSFIFLPGAYVGLLVTSQDAQAEMVRELATPLLVVAGFTQFFFGTYIVISQSLRGAGETIGPMVLTYASTFLIRLPAAYVIGVALGYGLTGIWVGLCAEIVIRACLFMGWFQMGRWERIKV